jgi:hypothetical protein
MTKQERRAANAARADVDYRTTQDQARFRNANDALRSDLAKEKQRADEAEKKLAESQPVEFQAELDEWRKAFVDVFGTQPQPTPRAAMTRVFNDTCAVNKAKRDAEAKLEELTKAHEELKVKYDELKVKYDEATTREVEPDELPTDK